jgi:3-phenylpropionate/trans-cinnamate dioxygenase ferredoxin reductase component
VTAPRRIAIVGAGVAGERCAFELRACGFDGDVLLVGAEPHLPYDRTLLSKDLLDGAVDAADLALSSREDFAAAGIRLCLGTAAAALDPDAHELVLADGTVIAYDKLVVATGGSPRRPRALGGAGAGVLRTLDDARALRERLETAGRLVVIGGGFVGAEVAASARARGLDVTLVEALPAPLARAVGVEVGTRIAELHRANGVAVLTDVAATALRRDGRRVTVGLADGRMLDADAVLVGAGTAPDVGWLAGSGVAADDGIVTDPQCRTSAPDVLAAGDCARWWHRDHAGLLRVEHWDTAARHGTAAARSALGDHQPFAPVPFFWSVQHGVRLQWVGHAVEGDEVVVEDAQSGAFVAWYRRAGRLVAAFAAGAPRALAAARRELQVVQEVAA